MEKDETMTIDHDHLDGQSGLCNKSWSENNWLQVLFFFLVSFVFVTLFSRSTSFLYLYEGGDPSIFKQMGLAILRGKTMYIDYFDNKGCLLYFIQALGLWLGGNFFILLMQVLSLTITLIMWDKMLALYRNERQRRICMIAALVMLLCFYSAGDQSQEWCLPYISYPLLIYFRAYKTKTEIRPIQMFYIGLCFGIVTFIQVNNACAFVGFIAWLWINYLLQKDFRRFFSSLMSFLAGLLMVTVVCVLYFYIKAGWYGVYEMFYASFLSNFEYIGANYGRRPFFTIPYFLFLLTFTLIQIVNSYKEKGIIIPMLISLILFALTFGKLASMYYLMAIMPLCIVSMMTIDFSERKKAKYGLCGIILICLAYFACNPLLHLVEDLILHKERELVIYEDFHHCIENIPEAERDSIYNYNLNSPGTSMMQHEGLLQCNRVLFSSLAFTLPTLWKQETSDIVAPKWMMLSWDLGFEKEDLYYILDNYDLYCEFMYDKIYVKKPQVGEAFKVRMYRRKD